MLDRAVINSNNFYSFHVLVAAQPSSLHIWWEPNISLTKVRMNVVCLKHRESLHWYLTFFFWAETWGSIFIVIVKFGIFLSGACHAYIITPFMSLLLFFFTYASLLQMHLNLCGKAASLFAQMMVFWIRWRKGHPMPNHFTRWHYTCRFHHITI